jgi:hypothetical protein
MTPTDHVAAAKVECQAIRSMDDYDQWHDKWASGESYLNLPDAEAAAVDALAEEGRERAMAFTFPVMAG